MIQTCSCCHNSSRSCASRRQHHRGLCIIVSITLLLYLVPAPAEGHRLYTGQRQLPLRCGTQLHFGSRQHKHLPQQQTQKEVMNSRASVQGSSWLASISFSRKLSIQQTPADHRARSLLVTVRTIIIPMYVHIVAVVDGGTTTANVSRHVIDQQVALLNSAYSQNAAHAGVRWQFQLTKVTYHTSRRNRDLCDAQSGLQLKQQLRKGGKTTLNMYITDLSHCGVLGVSTWPWSIDSSSLALDGVVVHHGTLPGGDYAPYNSGGTAVHETGHWLGLFHTFENGCVPPGDGVDDTPYCTMPTEMYCPKRRDSCPQAGEDPVNNWMGYGVDECMKEFTTGQIRRMEQLWRRYRAVE